MIVLCKVGAEKGRCLFGTDIAGMVLAKGPFELDSAQAAFQCDFRPEGDRFEVNGFSPDFFCRLDGRALRYDLKITQTFDVDAVPIAQFFNDHIRQGRQDSGDIGWSCCTTGMDLFGQSFRVGCTVRDYAGMVTRALFTILWGRVFIEVVLYRHIRMIITYF